MLAEIDISICASLCYTVIDQGLSSAQGKALPVCAARTRSWQGVALSAFTGGCHTVATRVATVLASGAHVLNLDLLCLCHLCALAKALSNAQTRLCCAIFVGIASHQPHRLVCIAKFSGN
eukprot:jgi/Ulvmu1/187/UM001_0191.1